VPANGVRLVRSYVRLHRLAIASSVRFWIEACELVCVLQLWKGGRPLDIGKQQGGNWHFPGSTYHILICNKLVFTIDTSQPREAGNVVTDGIVKPSIQDIHSRYQFKTSIQDINSRHPFKISIQDIHSRYQFKTSFHLIPHIDLPGLANGHPNLSD